MEINLDQDEIAKLRTRRNQVRGLYSGRNELFDRYEEIYFLRNSESPKMNEVDVQDIKKTTSPNGRDKVNGLKRILDTSEVHIKVKEKGSSEKIDKSDEIEAGLRKMLQVSGEYKPARIERDLNLASVLYGPVVLSCDSVDDLIKAKTKEGDTSGVNKFIRRQLETIRKRTPFLIETLNPKSSYPEQGQYGMVGHLYEYKENGTVIKERWGVDDVSISDGKEYTVQDFFHYDNRLVEVGSTTLFAGKWIAENEDGEAEGITNIPVFVRLAGGSTLFEKPEEQLGSFLYAYAKGEWDRRESLYWTYLFTSIYTKGLTGLTILLDPDSPTDADGNPVIKVNYAGNIKFISAKGTFQDPKVINGDVIQLKQLMEEQTSASTIQNQTIGGASDASTFSSYVMQMNAGKLPSIDPLDAQCECYKDLFLHILQRIKSEGIENDLISPADIPDDIELEVTIEPNLSQDDLRNAQIVAQLRNSGANVSDKWINTNLLKIADSDAMFREKAKEDLLKAYLEYVKSDQSLMQQFVALAMGTQDKKDTTEEEVPTDTTVPQGLTPDMLKGMSGNMNTEALPLTDAVTNRGG